MRRRSETVKDQGQDDGCIPLVLFKMVFCIFGNVEICQGDPIRMTHFVPVMLRRRVHSTEIFNESPISPPLSHPRLDPHHQSPYSCTSPSPGHSVVSAPHCSHRDFFGSTSVLKSLCGLCILIQTQGC